MKDFLKKLEEFTDINQKLIKTLFHLFIRPRKVIITDNPLYTSPIKYTIVVVTGIFFIMAFIDQIAIKEFQRPGGLLPLRVEFFNQEVEKILEEFGSIVLLSSVMPTLAIILRLVFFKTTTWRKSFKVSLYVNSQTILVYSVFSLISPRLSVILSFIYWLYALCTLFESQKKLKSVMKLLLVFILFFYITISFIVDIVFDTITNSLYRSEYYYPLVLSSTDDFIVDEIVEKESQKSFDNSQIHNPIHELIVNDQFRLYNAVDSSEWASIDLERFHPTKGIIWKSKVYSKEDFYVPGEPMMVLDSLNQQLIIAYTLATDSLTRIHLLSKSAKVDSNTWKTSIPIKLDYGNLERIAIGGSYLYLLGEAHLDIRELPWQAKMTVTFLIVVDIENGEIVAHDYFGKTFPYYSTTPDDIIVNDSTVEIYGTYQYTKFSNLIISSEHFRWVIQR